MLLRIQIDNFKKTHLHEELVSFLDRWTSDPEHPSFESGTRTALIRLLCQWCANCRSCVCEMISRPESMTIIGLITGGAGGAAGDAPLLAIERGLVAMLLGLWLEHLGDGEHAGWTRGTLLDLIKKRVGMTNFTNVLEAPRKNKDLFAAVSENDMEASFFEKVRSASEASARNGEVRR
jgi:hypothetical protein